MNIFERFLGFMDKKYQYYFSDINRKLRERRPTELLADDICFLILRDFLEFIEADKIDVKEFFKKYRIR